MAANDIIRKFGTPKTLEASGGSITNNSIVQANDASNLPRTIGDNALRALGWRWGSPASWGGVRQSTATRMQRPASRTKARCAP